MSKKHKKHSSQGAQSQPHTVADATHAGEYRIIKFDLVKVIILNVVYLAVILGLYYTNRQSHFLDNWFAKILHF